MQTSTFILFIIACSTACISPRVCGYTSAVGVADANSFNLMSDNVVLHRRQNRRGRNRNGGNNNDNKAANGPGFCQKAGFGNKIADGTQQRTSTCSVTVQGAIPAFENMVSTIITTPDNGASLKAGEDFTITVQTLNMDLGFFEDPNTRYYLTPQTLNGQGIIEGHQHVTIQNIGNGKNPPSPATEALTFFKGLDQDDVNGALTAVVPGSATANLAPNTNLRICTITGTRGHQPVIMPVARRGSQDDCIRVKMN